MQRLLLRSASLSLPLRRAASTSSYDKLETIKVVKAADHVLHVSLNRPTKRNAINMQMWRELRACFEAISVDDSCRSVLLSGEGHSFCSGIDLADFAGAATTIQGDAARKARGLHALILTFQKSLTAIEECPKPVIAAVHDACIGAGVDMITAADIRMCSADAYFQVKEVDIGLAADVGTLQRLPKVIGNQSLVRDLCFTARRLPASEAFQAGLVSRVCANASETFEVALATARLIAEKSPVAVQGTKVNLNFSRDHSVADGLSFVATWNAANLQSADVMEAVQASMKKTAAKFEPY